jgi:hypothetical protein
LSALIVVTESARMRINDSMRCLSIALILAACTHDHVIVGSGDGSAALVVKQVPTSPDFDVLFVIDNSSSTEDKQALLGSDFTSFVSALDAFPNGRPNLHIGVTTTSVDDGTAAAELSEACGTSATNGALQTGPMVSGNYIADIAGTDGSASRVTNYSGDLPSAFMSLASVGASGCGFEAPLMAIERALDGTTNPQNTGFLRYNADLMIIILTDEDDCSVVDDSIFTEPASAVGGLSDFRCQPLNAYDCDPALSTADGTYSNCVVHHGGPLLDTNAASAMLATVKDPSQTTVALMGGPPESTIMVGALTFADDGQTQDPALMPSCSVTLSDGVAIARPANRLSDFVSHYGPRGTFASVCQTDYSPALAGMGASMYSALTSDCLASNVDPTDTDPAMPGVQLACTVTDIYGTEQIAIPQCEMSDVTLPDPNGARPCWWAETDESCISQGGGELSYHIERATPPTDVSLTRIACQPTP